MESLIAFISFLYSFFASDLHVDGVVKLPNQAPAEFVVLFSQPTDAAAWYDATAEAAFIRSPPYEFGIDSFQLMTAINIDTDGAEPFECPIDFEVTCL